jgi:hypothetical protein
MVVTMMVMVMEGEGLLSPSVTHQSVCIVELLLFVSSAAFHCAWSSLSSSLLPLASPFITSSLIMPSRCCAEHLV